MTETSNMDERLHAAVQSYWDARARNKEKQVESRTDAVNVSEFVSGTACSGV